MVSCGRLTVRIPGRDANQGFVGLHGLKTLPEKVEKVGRRNHFFVEENYVILNTRTNTIRYDNRLFNVRDKLTSSQPSYG